MKITINEPIEYNIKTIKINAKVRDCFACSFHDESGIEIHNYDGYVPSFMPGQHFGDYIELEIDLETGKILNWPKDIQTKLQNWFNKIED